MDHKRIEWLFFVVFFLIDIYLGIEILRSPVNSGAFAMLAGLVLVPLVSLATRKPDKDTVDKMFSCYDKDVVVHAKESLGD